LVVLRFADFDDWKLPERRNFPQEFRSCEC
jgi:hypothetical protein